MQWTGETAATHRSGFTLKTLPVRLTELAQRRPRVRFTSLAHHITRERLHAAYKTLKRRASPGVDGVTVESYGRDLEKNIENLHGRLREGKYRAMPVRRIYILKENGKRRPIGIPALEDKIVQAAVVSLLEPIYEADFFDLSFGFRTCRSQHQALDAVLKPIKGGRVRWLLDVDLSGFFDSISHEWMMRFLEHRIADSTILRLIRRWLKAGVMEEGKHVATKEGTPQGGVLSPLLANIYLHYAFDWWAEREGRKRLRGEMYITRYADDIVVGFRYRSDGELFRKLMEERLKKFGLTLNMEKTRLVEFGRQSAFYAKREGRRLGTFDFLGFTHVSGRTRRGDYRCWRLTAKKRLKNFIQGTNEWCRDHRHLGIVEQWKMLCSKLRGHFQYFGFWENQRRLETVRWRVQRAWKRWLGRRSQRGALNWQAYERILERYPLPRPGEFCRGIA